MYGKFVSDLSEKGDKYGFVDEGVIRTGTGITLVLSLFSLFLVLFKGRYDIPLVLVSLIVIDFILKVFIDPKYSIVGSFVKLFRRKKEAKWVGAVQKRFAWSLGLFLSSFALYCILILGRYIATSSEAQEKTVSMILDGATTNIAQNALIVTPMNPATIACILCVVFMWCEAVLGYCVGCHIYGWLVKKGWMKEHRGQNCIDGICEVKK